MLPAIDLHTCQNDVHQETMQRIVAVESNGNDFAIGVVGGRLVRQPRSKLEAVVTAQSLHQAGKNFSVGLSQVNQVHFRRLGWDRDITQAFEPCTNLRAGAEILKDCYIRALGQGYKQGQQGLEAALSCYYSGSFVRGAQLGYVNKVLSAKPHDNTRLQLNRLTDSRTSPSPSKSYKANNAPNEVRAVLFQP